MAPTTIKKTTAPEEHHSSNCDDCHLLTRTSRPETLKRAYGLPP
jgi:hypothetical protein